LISAVGLSCARERTLPLMRDNPRKREVDRVGNLPPIPVGCHFANLPLYKIEPLPVPGIQLGFVSAFVWRNGWRATTLFFSAC
jgi:hypothetical protein